MRERDMRYRQVRNTAEQTAGFQPQQPLPLPQAELPDQGMLDMHQRQIFAQPPPPPPLRDEFVHPQAQDELWVPMPQG